MARYAANWAAVAVDQYLALPPDLQHFVDARVAEILDRPDGPDSSYDLRTDHWTTTAAAGRVLLVYVFRAGLPTLAILRLIRI